MKGKIITNIKHIVRSSPFFNTIWQKYICRIICSINPKILANLAYKSRFHKDIDWDNPKDLIEKIYWLQFNSDTTLWSKCADKYKVREYVAEKGLKNILNELYGVYDKVDEINWDTLPNQFVLKWNNGSGQVLIVKDKSKLNINATKKILSQWLTSNYGYEGAQLHYTRIKSCIIAEELLINTIDTNKSLTDYKIWCFHGKPNFILVVYDRVGENYKLSAFDLEWNNISKQVLDHDKKHYGGDDVSKPNSLDDMLEMSKTLSSEFIEVRVDFYEINQKPIFGELTFTTGYGNYSYECYCKLGEYIDLTKSILNKNKGN